MNNKLIPLSTISLMLAIARPAMAATGTKLTLADQIEFAAIIFAALGIGFLLVGNTALAFNFFPREESFRNITRVSAFFLITSVVATTVLIMI
jgi:hypothetical protein